MIVTNRLFLAANAFKASRAVAPLVRVTLPLASTDPPAFTLTVTVSFVVFVLESDWLPSVPDPLAELLSELVGVVPFDDGVIGIVGVVGTVVDVDVDVGVDDELGVVGVGATVVVELSVV